MAVLGLVGFGIKSLPRQALGSNGAITGPLMDAPPRFEPSEKFRDSLVQKAKILEEDLSRAPNDAFLIASLAETTLYLALTEYQLNGGMEAAQPWLRRSQKYVNRLQSREKFAYHRLDDVLRHFPRIRFSPLAWPSVTASLWRLQAGRTTLFAPTVTGGVTFIRRRRDVTGLPPSGEIAGGGAFGGTAGPPPGSPPPGSPPSAPPVGSAFGDPPPRPAPHLPGYPGAPGVLSPMMPGYGPGGGPPLQRILTPPPGAILPSASPDDAQRLRQLRQLWAERPRDLHRADQLAGELLRQSAGYQSAAAMNAMQAKAKQQVAEAAEVYERIAPHAPLRVQRAAFYAAAADARRRLEDWDEQYRLLHQAIDNVPFAPAVWQDLKTSALRLGKSQESLAATHNESNWRFPSIEATDERP